MAGHVHPRGSEWGGTVTCTNPSCKNPGSVMAAKGLCWPCYQKDRRTRMVKLRVPECVPGRRYHSYDEIDRCKYCGAVRIF